MKNMSCTVIILLLSRKHRNRDMDCIKTFLESSSIHGVSYISTTRKCARLFWICVVTFGFTGAAYLILQSFKAWDESPVSTTIETLPITEITFPKVTVCPPKNTFTDLNYDLMMTEKMTLDNETREQLGNYAVRLLHDYLYDTIMKNLSLLEDKDRYYNWYHGYTEMNIPQPGYQGPNGYDIEHSFRTFATSGTVSTKYFGDKFDAEKVLANIKYQFYMFTPENARGNENVTFHMEIDKISMKDLSTGKEVSYLGPRQLMSEETEIVKNYTPPEMGRILFFRKVSRDDIKVMNLELMPGMKVSWYYTGMEVEPKSYWFEDTNTMSFIRNIFHPFLLPFDSYMLQIE